jgi:hypothetical protein
MSFINTTIEDEFVNTFLDFVKHDRLETFYDPYTGGYLPLMWDLTNEYDEIGSPNQQIQLSMDTIEHAVKKFYGAKLNGILFNWGGPFAVLQNTIQDTGTSAQYKKGSMGAKLLTKTAIKNIANSQVESAFSLYSESWLLLASRCIFMSYFIELPDLESAGLRKTYRLLQVVSEIVNVKNNFHTTGPMEFRFVKGGDSVMAGTYNTNTDKIYVNLDLIAFVNTGKFGKNPKNYPRKLLHFMASVERKWYAAGGLPHQGKMYGFFDPDGEDENYCAPYNGNYINKLNDRRDERDPGARKAFNEFRKEMDPKDMFLNNYMKKLIADVY